ncbi:tripartite tricarboxylate transporter permease [Geomicrobium sp. JSM 1781026]|uniref:tripartite tricarboxylate transporter permease n=1 Tax=Geomicrobium sp. JSM 1781026 TaxID=3344580 RepID=UPI0035BF3986
MNLWEGFLGLADPMILILLITGVLLGVIIGSLPGLTATMGVALFLPVTFGMEAIPGLLLLVGIYFGSIYGGSIAAILLNTPGTPAAAATAMDGYAMTKKGDARTALNVAVIASGFGSIISVLMLIFLSPQLANIALSFSAPEMFGLALFGLSIISSIAGSSLVKGLIAGVVGLLIATIGMDPMTSYPRYTFDQPVLLEGFDFIPIMIGLFAVSEAFIMADDYFKEKGGPLKVTAKLLKTNWRIMPRLFPTMTKSSILGSLIGIIPGAGADVAAFVSYNEAQRFAKKEDKELFGKGNPKGIAAAESGNQGVTGGAMVPLLTLGIPGDAVAAVMLGAFVVQGIQPGPQIFQTSGELIYILFAGMLVAAVVMVIIGLLGIRLFTKVLLVPKTLMITIILVLSTVGAFAINNNIFDVYVVLGAGIIGFFMKKHGFPASPIVLALILGPMAESEFRRALTMSEGSMMIFATRPIAATLIVLAILSLFTPLFMKLFKNRKGKTVSHD